MRYPEEEEGSGDKKNGTFESGLRGSRRVFLFKLLMSVTDTFYMERDGKKKINYYVELSWIIHSFLL